LSDCGTVNDMWYELWDRETGNRVGKYPTEEAALRAVLEDIGRYGRSAGEIVSLGLLQRDPEHRQDRLVAEGAALVERALAVADLDRGNGVATTPEPAKQPRR
jgi:hypothetical protein